MNAWNLRDEILAITHRWASIVVFLVAGAVMGLGSSYLWPSPYRATLDLYIGLDAYRSPYDSYVASVAQQEFRMVDDYKNWQMQQLNTLILTDAFLDETLARLRVQDSSWSDVSAQDLRGMAGVHWRNAGEWHLSLEMDDPDRASAALDTWASVVDEKINTAIEHSKQVVALDVQMTSLAAARQEATLRQEALRLARARLADWQDRPGQVVTVRQHGELLAWVAQAAAWTPVWDEVLEAAPQPNAVGAAPQDYLAWLELILPLVDVELDLLPGKIALLETQFSQAEADYVREASQSLALSSTLVVQKVSDARPQVERVHPRGVLTLVGGALGLGAWGILLFARVSRKNP